MRSPMAKLRYYHHLIKRRLSTLSTTTFCCGDWKFHNASTAYVEDQMQSVHLNGSISRLRRVICGVPQGSVLGPLLFTLCTEDIGIIVQSFGLKHHTYVDDNQIDSSCFPAECASLKIKLIDCIDFVDKWMASNRLTLNPSKSEFLWRSLPCRVLR